jgi:hypothetical protein
LTHLQKGRPESHDRAFRAKFSTTVVAGGAPEQLLEIKAKTLFSLVFKPCQQNKRSQVKTPDKVGPKTRARLQAICGPSSLSRRTNLCPTS